VDAPLDAASDVSVSDVDTDSSSEKPSDIFFERRKFHLYRKGAFLSFQSTSLDDAVAALCVDKMTAQETEKLNRNKRGGWPSVSSESTATMSRMKKKEKQKQKKQSASTVGKSERNKEGTEQQR
jgi:hypothetical protein